MLRSATAFLAACLLFTASADAGETSVDVSESWVALPPDAASVAAGYMKLSNTGENDLALISASSDCCDVVELHEHVMDGDKMSMRQTNRVSLPANKMVAFKPGGLHLMLIGLKQPLKEGEKVEITLGFEDASQIVQPFTVKPRSR